MIDPQIILLNKTKDILSILREDSKEINEKNSFLYHLLHKDDNGNEIKIENQKIYTEAKEIFSRKKEDKRYIDSFIGFNRQRTQQPSIHILMPNESTASIGIGDNLGYKDLIESFEPNEAFEQYSNNYSATFNLILSSNVLLEILIMYNTFKACFIALREQFEDDGFQNIKISGADIQIQQDIMPVDMIHRTLTISFTYDFNTPSLFRKKFLKKINFTPTMTS